MRLPYLLVFLVIIYGVIGHQSNLRLRKDRAWARDLNKQGSTNEEHSLCSQGECKRTIAKRSLFSAIVAIAKVAYKGTKIVLKAGTNPLTVFSLAFTISNAATDGCAFFPDICTNRDKLKVLEQECYDLVEKLKTKYDGADFDYEILRDVTLNNIDLEKALSDLAAAVDDINGLSAEVDSILNGNSTTSNLTAEQWAQLAVLSSEYRLSTLDAEIQKLSKENYKAFQERLAWCVAYYAGAAGYYSFKAAYSIATGPTTLSKVGQALKTMMTNSVQFVTNFKTRVTTAISQKMQNLKSAIQNPKQAVKAYSSGITAAHSFMNLAAVACNAYVLYTETKAWEEAAQEVQKAVRDYEQYKIDLQAAWDVAVNTSDTVAETKVAAIDAYNSMVRELSNTIDTLVENNTDAIESLRPETDPAALPAMLLEDLSNGNDALEKQAALKSSLQDTQISMEKYQGWNKAMNTIAKSVRDFSASGMDAIDILANLANTFQYQPDNAKLFSSLVSLPSVICVLSYEYPKLTAYGAFPLDSMRDTCAQGTPTSFTQDYVDAHKQMTIDYTVRETVSTLKAARAAPVVDICDPIYSQNPTECTGQLQDVMTALKVYFTKSPLLDVNEIPSWKTVVYKIAELFPNDDELLFFNLVPFRNSNTMTDVEFSDYYWDAGMAYFDCVNKAYQVVRTTCRVK